MTTIISPLADLVAWVIVRLHAGLGALFGPNTGLAWGLSIAILVILIRVCLIPLFVKQVHAQRKMAQHAPQLAELRKRYKNDKQRLNEETMKFYKENGVNPLAGCLPMIPQMIIFFSLFYVLRAIAEWKQGVKPSYGMTVSLMESAQKATIFGIHLGDKLLLPHTPSMGLGTSLIAAATVAISATTTFLTVRQSAKRGLMQTNMDPGNPMAQSQKYMQYIVPFFSLTGLYWQYGLVLYWVTTNMWTLGQQYFMFRNWEPINATADAAAAPARTRQGSRPATAGAKTAASSATKTRPAANGASAAKTTTGSAAKAPGSAAKAPGSAAKAPGSAAKAPGSTTAAGGAAKAASTGAGTGTGTRDGSRSGTTAPRANGMSGSSGAAKPGTASDRVRTGNAGRDAAANSPGPANGQNGAAKRSLLRLGRPKPEPEPEPEAPVAKVVRQQPQRQARSKRSGKR
ncbi:MAG: membrane protein insertase YidC [Streptosporangiaceae bacterium]